MNSASKQPFAGLRPGSSFGSYDVVRCVGIGGMGSVFEAKHRLMQRRVALKVLHSNYDAGFDARGRFLREGATLVRVSHPQIVSVYDAGEVDGLPYIAMELLEGATLDRILDRDGMLSAARAVALIAPVGEGLAAAHAVDIVHRDVKPENLFVTRDGAGRETLKLVDFGIAKDIAVPGAKNTMIGTPDYMSPEQLLGGDVVDGRTDQYALAVVLYQALTGTRPYVSDSILGLASLIEKGNPVPPSARGALVPKALEAAVLRALSTNADHRFPTIAEFAAVLRSSVTSSLSVVDEALIASGQADFARFADEPIRDSRTPTVSRPISKPPPPQSGERPVLPRAADPAHGNASASDATARRAPNDDARVSGRRVLAAMGALFVVVVIVLVAALQAGKTRPLVGDAHEEGEAVPRATATTSPRDTAPSQLAAPSNAPNVEPAPATDASVTHPAGSPHVTHPRGARHDVPSDDAPRPRTPELRLER